MRLEGSSKLTQAIRIIGHNRDIDVHFASVVEPLPNLRINLADWPLILDKSDLLITESVSKGNIVIGDILILLELPGGQKFVVLDKLAR